MQDDLYTRLGIDLTQLGCVMLDVEPHTIGSSVAPGLWLDTEDDTPHITLLFGLLSNANTIRAVIDEVLTGWTPTRTVSVTNFRCFPGSERDAVVALVDDFGWLRDAHNRLSRLPHVNTFPYTPHITIGYTASGCGRYALPDLEEERARADQGRFTLRATGLNYGRADA